MIIQKITILIVMGMLCLKFEAKAQDNNAIDVIKKGLQIGQQVPDLILTNLHNYKNQTGKSVSSAKLSDFKGKLLILDFWATWCAPCLSMIPKLENLQNEFEGKLQILPITYEKEEIALPFLTTLKQQKRSIGSLPNIVADKELHQFFPHVYLPHYVWIDGNGKIRAITDSKPLNTIEINKVLNEDFDGLAQKKDLKIALNKDLPLFFNGNGGDGATMTYHSMLSTYVAGISSGFSITPPIEGDLGFSKLLAKNVGIMRLFNLAIAEGKKQFTSSRTIYETKDSLLIDPMRMGNNWRTLSWTYELSLPIALQAVGYQIMHNELIKFFPQYSIKLEKRKTLCYALQKITGKTIIPSTGGEKILIQNPTSLRMHNGTLNLFINTLDVFYFSTSKVPIVNLVEDKTPTDLIINAPLTDVNAINLELAKYGLKLVKGEFDIDMIVYKDTVN